MQKNFNTPIEEIFFRSSKVGLIAGGLTRFELTDNQKKEIEDLEKRKEQVIGLTANQQKDLDKWNKSVEEGKELTQTQREKRDDYTERLTKKKGLTPTQKARLEELKEKAAREPELSQGAKTYIKEVWLKYEKGFEEEITSKHTRKGQQAEEDAINLISIVDGYMYTKNKKRVKKNNLSGECDVNTYFDVVEKRIIDDLKCSWNPKTFMMTNFSSLEEWQGRAYMYLYDADIFRLRRCLVDCPPDVYVDEFKKFCWANQIIDGNEDNEEYKPIIDQFKRNFLYEHSGRYTKEERVKTFAFYRDLELEKILLKSIELALEYYKTITLNMIE